MRLLSAFEIISKYGALWALLAVLLASCAGSKAPQDSYLIYSQAVKGNKKVGDSPLENLYQQRTNRKILWTMPYIGIYRLGRHFFDSSKVERKIAKTKEKYQEKLQNLDPESDKYQKTLMRKDRKISKLKTKLKEGNWLMSSVGEPPSYLDTAKTGETTRQMEKYLFKEGFFNGRVNYSLDTLSWLGRKVRVNYHVREGKATYISDVRYASEQQALVERLNQSRDEFSQLQPGKRYSEDLLMQEQKNLTDFLKNKGYFGFQRSFVFFRNDTTVGENQVAIEVLIKKPPEGRHRRYPIDSIFFTVPAIPGTQQDMAWQEVNGIHFYAPTQGHNLKVLASKVRFRPTDSSGVYYEQKTQLETQANLAGMDAFKFVNLRTDTLGGDANVYINTSRLDKYSFTTEGGLVVSQGTPGPFGNLSLKARNLFGGFETIEMGLRYSAEGTISPLLRDSAVYLAREISFNSALRFPSILFPHPKVRNWLNEYQPNSQLKGSFTSVRRPEYSRMLGRASWSYNLTTRDDERFTDQVNVTVGDVSLNYTLRKNSQFQEWLIELRDRGNFLIESFRQSVTTSLNGYWIRNQKQQAGDLRNYYFKLYAEHGGLAPYGVKQTLALDESGADSLYNLRYFQFFKFTADFRNYLHLGENTTIATRLNGGIAAPYGLSNTLPYEKFFFSGGSNSVRAWQPRRLGPGGYNQEADNLTIFEQPGNIIMEGNIELRQDLFWYLEGALFLDAGNVWTISDPSRPGGAFGFDFYRELGIGTGVGLRFDFDFLVIRFDYGIRISDPARPEGERLVVPDWSFRSEFLRNNTVLNFGVGYPF